jgi:hypothetical protein
MRRAVTPREPPVEATIDTARGARASACLILIGVGARDAATWYRAGGALESTNDAFVEGICAPVAARRGQVIEVAGEPAHRRRRPPASCDWPIMGRWRARADRRGDNRWAGARGVGRRRCVTPRRR